MSNTSMIRMQKALYTIKDTLSNDEVIKKLLGNMVPNAMSLTAPTSAWFKDHNLINLTPYIDYENGIKDSHRNGFITVFIENINKIMDSLVFSINIAVMVREEYYEIDNNKIRVLEIISRILDLLDGKKLQVAGKMSFMSSETLLIENAKMIGMFSHWEVVDGESNSENI